MRLRTDLDAPSDAVTMARRLCQKIKATDILTRSHFQLEGPVFRTHIRTMAPELRSRQFIFRVSPTEIAMLQAVAEYTGLSAADVLRTHIRESYRRIHGDKKPAKKKAAKRG